MQILNNLENYNINHAYKIGIEGKTKQQWNG